MSAPDGDAGGGARRDDAGVHARRDDAGVDDRGRDAAASGREEATAKAALSLDDLPSLAYDEGLVPVVAQDHVTGQVLMLAWASQDALEASLRTGWMTYWSRSRKQLWEKGATSGNRQRLVSLHADCDADAVLAKVEQEGPACHTGTAGCWSGDKAEPAGFLGHLDRMAAQRAKRPAGRYTDKLLAEPALAAAKVEEEAGELARILRGEPNEDTLEHEAADLLYHLIVAVRAGGGSLEDVLRELARRG